MIDSANPIDDCGENQESVDKKILDEFKKYEKGFAGKSKPVYWNHCGEKITLKKIHDNANIGDNSIVLIAVTREQYHLDNFPKYRKYLKDTLNENTIYYGLWPDKDKNKVEYDISYAIENNPEEIQKHLNQHNHKNNGVAQKMALIIDKDGNWRIQNNENL
jgi:hypothetical protein